MWISAAIFGCVYLTVVSTAQQIDPTNDFCCISGHSMTRAGDSLYIIGGYAQYTNNSFDGPNTVIRSINVSKNFYTSVDSVSYVQTDDLAPQVPRLSISNFWTVDDAGDQLELSFGKLQPGNVKFIGERPVPPQGKKWQYDTGSKNWTELDTTLPWLTPEKANDPFRTGTNMQVYVPRMRRGYMLSGVLYNTTSIVVKGVCDSPGLLTYDKDSNSWTNSTLPFGADTAGSLVHIPTANDDVLIHFGGLGNESTAPQTPQSLGKIYIYSTKQAKWFSHFIPPRKPIPVSRVGFCTSVVSAADGSSHQIFLIGGAEITPPPSDNVGDVAVSIWVLNIPSFDWVQLPFNAKSTNFDPQGRIDPTCATISQHYILLYGGRKVNSFRAPSVCENRANVVFLLDTNQMLWTSDYIPNKNATYQIAQSVYNLIGGNANGGATKMVPDGGFQDPELTSIMSMAIITPTGKPSETPFAPGNATANPPNPPTSNSVIPAVVTPLVVLAVLIGGFMLYRRHTRKKATATADDSNMGELSPDGMPYDPVKSRTELDGVNNPTAYHRELDGAYLPSELNGVYPPSELNGNYDRNYRIAELEAGTLHSVQVIVTNRKK